MSTRSIDKAGTDPEWDRHKATIESLYVEQNLKLEGSGGLIDTMARSYSFAKKYESPRAEVFQSEIC